MEKDSRGLKIITKNGSLTKSPKVQLKKILTPIQSKTSTPKVGDIATKKGFSLVKIKKNRQKFLVKNKLEKLIKENKEFKERISHLETLYYHQQHFQKPLLKEAIASVDSTVLQPNPPVPESI